jgi:hypothetical protein
VTGSGKLLSWKTLKRKPRFWSTSAWPMWIFARTALDDDLALRFGRRGPAREHQPSLITLYGHRVVIFSSDTLSLARASADALLTKCQSSDASAEAIVTGFFIESRRGMATMTTNTGFFEAAAKVSLSGVRIWQGSCSRIYSICQGHLYASFSSL